MNTKKKLLILIDWFTPGYKAGGPVQSCINICSLIKTQYDIYVLTTDTDHGDTIPYKDISTNQWIKNEALGVQVFYAEKRGLSATLIKKQIQQINADTVYLNLLFSPYFTIYPLWLKYRGIIKSKLVLCPRGTLYDSALAVKRNKKTPFLFLLRKIRIDKLVVFHATNKREEEAILKYFPGSKTVIANNLPAVKQAIFDSLKKVPGFLKCIFIARIVPIKNLLYILQLLKDIQQDVELTIVGPAENELYWQECKKLIEALPQNISVNYIGPQENLELKSLIREHHLFILPTQGENFGHAIFESLLAGRPVLISNQTPWLNLYKDKAGWDYPLDKPDQFTEVINNLANADQQEFDQYAMGAWQYANRFINNPELIKPYQTLFE